MIKVSEISKPDKELYLWVALALLEADPYEAFEKRLSEIRVNCSEEASISYIEFANDVLEEFEKDKATIFTFLIDLIVSSKVAFDKLADITKLAALSSSYVAKKSEESLEKFKDLCLKDKV